MSGPIANAACASAPLSAAPLPGESGVYRAGPVTISVGDDLAQAADAQLSRPTGREAIATVIGDRPVLLSVDPSSRGRFALQFRPPAGRGAEVARIADGRRAVRFPACGQTVHRFDGGLVFSGVGCARLHVAEPGHPAMPMLIPIGNRLRGCPAAPAGVGLPIGGGPYLGVACRAPNSIVCDRVGVGVHLRRPATVVVVQLAGRLVTLSPPNPPGPLPGADLWVGYLQAAGLTHGPLDLHLPRGARMWFGETDVAVSTRVTAYLPDGRVGRSTATVPLGTGFG